MRPLLLLTLATACAGDGPATAAEWGEEVFHDPGLSDSAFNVFSCATCHETRAGAPPAVAHTLHNVAFRGSWWGGYASRLLDAVNFCAVSFMRAEPIEAADPRGRALYEYLVEESPDRPAPPLSITIVENVSDLPRGPVSRGETAWRRACRPCHGDAHTGRDRITPLASIVPEASIGFAKSGAFDPALVVIEKVRHGAFFGVGGTMPPFSREALSDEDLGAILNYLGLGTAGLE